METLETTDLFKSASLLCLGANLLKVRRERGEVHFILKGAEIFADDMDYRTGNARVNPLELKIQLNYLRDLIFERSRKGQERYSDSRRKNRAA